MKSMALWLFLILAFPNDLFASTGPFCLNTSNQQKVHQHYSIDFKIKQATDRAEWIWHHPEWDDDELVPDYIQSSDGTLITRLPELYDEKCSSVQSLLGQCRVSTSLFSATAKMAFLYGYQANLAGTPERKSYAAYGQTIIALPSEGNRATRFRGDATAFGFAALEGLKGELVLFNGDRSYALGFPEAAPRKDGFPAWVITVDANTGRVFLHTISYIDTKPFLYEIVAGPALQQITLDPNVNGWMSLLSNPITKQMVLIDRYGVYLERDGAFKRVMHFATDADTINGPAYVGYTEANEIYFEVTFDKTKRRFFDLVPKFDYSKCVLRLDAQHDQILADRK